MGGGLGTARSKKKKEKEEKERQERILIEAAREKERQEKQNQEKERELQRLAGARAKQEQQRIDEIRRIEDIQEKEKNISQQQEKLEQERRKLEAELRDQKTSQIEAQQEEERRRQIEIELRQRQQELRQLDETLSRREVDLKIREAQIKKRAEDKVYEEALLQEVHNLPSGPKDGEAMFIGDTRRLLFSRNHNAESTDTKNVLFKTAAIPPGWSARQSAVDDNIRHRFLRIFVSSSLQGNEEHALLRAAVYPGLISEAARRGVALHFIDLRDALRRAEGGGAELAWEASTVGLLLREVERCQPWFIGLLGNAAGGALGQDLCGRLEAAGHAWVAEEGLAAVACHDVLARFAALRDPPPGPAAPAACLFLQQTATADRADAEPGTISWEAGGIGAGSVAARGTIEAPPTSDNGAVWREETVSAEAEPGALGVSAQTSPWG